MTDSLLLLFAHCASLQESTHESPFYLAETPAAEVLSLPKERCFVDAWEGRVKRRQATAREACWSHHIFL